MQRPAGIGARNGSCPGGTPRSGLDWPTRPVRRGPVHRRQPRQSAQEPGQRLHPRQPAHRRDRRRRPGDHPGNPDRRRPHSRHGSAPRSGVWRIRSGSVPNVPPPHGGIEPPSWPPLVAEGVRERQGGSAERPQPPARGMSARTIACSVWSSTAAPRRVCTQPGGGGPADRTPQRSPAM